MSLDKSKTPEYRIWISMRSRCSNAKNTMFHLYGGRGISVCAQWMRSFDCFIRDIGPRPSPAHSLDRFPNQNGNYEPCNVRWATAKEQSRNTRSNRMLTFFGKTMTAIEWSEHTGVKFATLMTRLHRGYRDPEFLFSAPRPGRRPKRIQEKFLQQKPKS